MGRGSFGLDAVKNGTAVLKRLFSHYLLKKLCGLATSRDLLKKLYRSKNCTGYI
jgi:hypothetical protein